MSRRLAIFYDLYLMQLANYRWTWKWQIIWGLIAPLSFMFTLRTVLARDVTPDLGAQILAGNLILSSLLTTMGNTANRFAWLKEFEGLDYYATLPISRAAMVATVVLAFVTLTVPSMVATVLLGRALLALPLAPHPLALLVVVLTALSLSTVGAGIGIMAPDTETQGVISNLALFVLLFLSPVLVPVERLPSLLQVTSRLLPTSYAVDALRHLLVGVVDAQTLHDVAVLAAFSCVALSLAARRLDWRRR